MGPSLTLGNGWMLRNCCYKSFAKNMFPDDCTFNTLVDSFCKEGMVREAQIAIDVMIDRDLDVKVAT